MAVLQLVFCLPKVVALEVQFKGLDKMGVFLDKVIITVGLQSPLPVLMEQQ